MPVRIRVCHGALSWRRDSREFKNAWSLITRPCVLSAHRRACVGQNRYRRQSFELVSRTEQAVRFVPIERNIEELNGGFVVCENSTTSFTSRAVVQKLGVCNREGVAEDKYRTTLSNSSFRLVAHELGATDGQGATTVYSATPEGSSLLVIDSVKTEFDTRHRQGTAANKYGPTFEVGLVVYESCARDCHGAAGHRYCASRS